MGRVIATGRSVVLTRLGRVGENATLHRGWAEPPSTSEAFAAYLSRDHDRRALTVEDVESGFDTGGG